jgi:maltooligosyltrehalose trehalohydrolase
MIIGSDYHNNKETRFSVWAPKRKKVALHLVYPENKIIELNHNRRDGYWYLVIGKNILDYKYFYQLDEKEEFPDPASNFQPEGIYGPSQIIDHSFSWTDNNWPGIELSDMIIYELHVGTFTTEGTFEAIIPRLNELARLGVNTIELMPIAQFPGERNWGYDGVFPFAVQNSYGTPDNLKNLINTCHQKGFAVLLDVVYNHLGPEGNYLPQFGPYFTDKYHSNWGKGINFDGPFSNEVRNYFIQNALYWLKKYHFDGLRLDAIHSIFDMNATHILPELSLAIRKLSKKNNKIYHLIAESDLNNNKIVRGRQRGGYQLDAQWSDDFHHSLHALLTGEKFGYYQDFGKIQDLVKAIKEGFVYSGQYSSFRKKNHGNSSRFIPTDKFVVYSQNHDQVGNRMLGERLSSLVSLEELKLAAAITILSPYIPLLFMGEEYGEDSPFLYFINHKDHHLVQAVREGRKKEFAQFQWQQEPPDPQDKSTFQKSKINWQKRKENNHAVLLNFYSQLIKLRKKHSLLRCPGKKQINAWASEEKKVLIQKRVGKEEQFLLIANFNSRKIKYNIKQCKDYLLSDTSIWQLVFNSNQKKWLGKETLTSDIFYEKDELILKPSQFLLYRQKGVNNKNGKE